MTRFLLLFGDAPRWCACAGLLCVVKSPPVFVAFSLRDFDCESNAVGQMATPIPAGWTPPCRAASASPATHYARREQIIGRLADRLATIRSARLLCDRIVTPPGSYARQFERRGMSVNSAKASLEMLVN